MSEITGLNPEDILMVCRTFKSWLDGKTQVPADEFQETVSSDELVDRRRNIHAMGNPGKLGVLVDMVARKFLLAQWSIERAGWRRDLDLEKDQIEYHVLVFLVAARLLEKDGYPLKLDERVLSGLDKLAPGHEPWLASWKKIDTREIEKIFSRLEPIQRLAMEHSQPTFLVEKLMDFLPSRRVKDIIAEQMAPRVFFVNCRDEKVLAAIKRELASKKVAYQQLKSLGHVLRLPNHRDVKSRLLRGHHARDHDILVQDLGSIAVMRAIRARPGDLVLDGCAAPFQKTLALEWQVRPGGKVVALDIHGERILSGVRRLSNCNTIIHPVNCDVLSIPRMYRGPEPAKILLDVPCTGSGAIISSPSLIFMQRRENLEFFSNLQSRILKMIVKTCRARRWNSKIVYATCSYYPEEGEHRIDEIIDDIILDDLHEDGMNLSRGYQGFACSKKVGRTFPDRHEGSKGFFLARFKVKERES